MEDALNSSVEIVKLNMWLLFLLKSICFIIGFLTIYLGYKLVSAGVRGEFKFQGEMEGMKAALESVSPGLLFVLLGIILIGYAMFVDKPFGWEFTDQQSGSTQSDPPHIDIPIDDN